MLKCVTFAAVLVACFGVARGQDGPAKVEQLKKEIAELRTKLEAKEAELARLDPIKVDLKITADQLYTAYLGMGEDEANKRYRGKTVMVLGRIHDVIESPNGVVAVYPTQSDVRDRYRLCIVMKKGHEAAGLKLRPGDPFRLVGEVAGRVEGVVLVGHATIAP